MISERNTMIHFFLDAGLFVCGALAHAGLQRLALVLPRRVLSRLNGDRDLLADARIENIGNWRLRPPRVLGAR